MALRISVDLDGLRWADLFRFVDLARNGGIGPDDTVDVITYGSDPMSVSLSARIFPSTESGFLSVEPEQAPADNHRPAPLSISAGPSANGASPFGYDNSQDRSASQNGSHYPSFDGGAPERPSAPPPSGLPYGGYDQSAADRGAPGAPGGYPQFDGQQDRLGGAPGGQYAGFEPAFDRSGQPKDMAGGQNGVDSPYIEEFARLQEGLMRQVRRNDEVRPERA
ncbi:MAG: hypothetical protein IRZ08_22095 [Frankia sp.]|nr:hypothetical protein [Frankia sp.]